MEPELTPMQRLRRDLLDLARRSTSSRDPAGTRRLVTCCLTDASLRAKLAACNGRAPCWSATCPTCAGRRGRRFFRNSLAPAVEGLHWESFRWVTINVIETETLEEGAQIMEKREHRALRHIVETLRGTVRLIRSRDTPENYRVRVWGAREVEPVRTASDRVRWRWHWHLLVHLDGLDDALLAESLRDRWPDARSVRIDEIKAKTTKQFWRSLARMASYPVKARYTISVNDRREWLPAQLIDELAQWRASRPSRWSRFTLGASSVAQRTSS